MSYLSGINPDWRIVELGAIVAESQYGLSLSSSPKGRYPMLRMNNLSDGNVSGDDVVHVELSDAELRNYRLRHGDLLFNRTNSADLVGKTAVFDLNGDYVFASYLVRFVIRQELADPHFVAYWFDSTPGKARLRELATLGVSQCNINPTNLQHSFHLPLPPLTEQRKIACILSRWDQALETIKALVTAKTERLCALRQQLLNGTRKFSTNKRERWRKVQLAEVAENVSERNQGQLSDDKLYAVTKAEGMIPMREHVKGESQVRCKIVAQNWFAYNPMRLNIGSIARWQKKEPVMVSGDYVVFRCREEALLPDYLDHLRRSGRWTSFVKSAGNGSVRVRIYFDDLGHLSFPLPPIHEQRRIADVLNACNQEIRLLEAELEARKQQKRGLMQKLLTGEIRVKTKEKSK